jgi:hypothetical protein
MAEIFGTDFSPLNDESLFRNLDRLQSAAGRNRARAGGTSKDFVYARGHRLPLRSDSTYFGGEMAGNPKPSERYSRDKRPDCKQVLVGFVLDHNGFPKRMKYSGAIRQDRT